MDPYDRETTNQPTSSVAMPCLPDDSTGASDGAVVNGTQPIGHAAISGNRDATGISASASESAAQTATVSDDTPIVAERTPYFADQEAFLAAVFGNWMYWLRVLVGKFPYLVERRRETGKDAPLPAWWHANTDMPADVDIARTQVASFDNTIGSCDPEDIILAAIKRCTKPMNQSFYANYTPNRNGTHVKFTTWFVNHLRSIAGSRIRSWKRRPWQETHLLNQTRSSQHKRERFTLVDTFMCPKRPPVRETPERPELTIESAAASAKVPVSPGETVEAFLAHGGQIRRVPDCCASNLPSDLEAARDEEMKVWMLHNRAQKKRTERRDPGYHPSYSRIENRLDVARLTRYMKGDQKECLDILLDHDACASMEFAQVMGCTYSQGRSKASYIRKKLRQYLHKSDTKIL